MQPPSALPKEVHEQPVMAEVPKRAPKGSRFFKRVLTFIVLMAIVLVGLYFLNESDYLDEKYKVDTDAWIEWLKKQFHWLKKHFY